MMSKMVNGAIGAASIMVSLAPASPAWGAAPNCRPNCPNLETSARPTSIMPPPDAFARFGEDFGAATRLAVPANGLTTISLGFTFTIGTTAFTSVSVRENALLTFDAPAIGGQSFAGAAAAAFAPYITPFQADLMQDFDSSTSTGDIYVATGEIDPYADSGNGYQDADRRKAVKITWYGTLTDTGQIAATGAPVTAPVYAEVILSGDGGTSNTFSFRWGTERDPSQAAYRSQAGFVFYDQRYLYSPAGGRYSTDTSASTFDVEDGQVVGELFPSAVPEPATWAMMLLGFALVGRALRRPRGYGAVQPERRLK